MRKLYSLKNFFATCLLLMVGALGAWAQGTTVTFTAGTDKGDDTQHTLTKDGVTITVERGTSTSGIGYLAKYTQYRFYKGNNITIASSKGNITKIVFTCATSYGPGNFASSDNLQITDLIGTWTGDAASIKFSASSGQVRATKIEVTYTPASNVAAPKFSPDSQDFTKPFSVTITAEDGADIYYATGDTELNTSSTKYTVPIDITTTTTLKAFAVKDGKNSNVTTATYTYVVNAPIIGVDSKTFSDPFEVTLTPGEDAEDAKIYYTLDGTEPEPKAESAEIKEYTEPIQITKTTTLKAIAWKNNTKSEVVTATYTYKDPAANDGTFAKPYTVEEIKSNNKLKGQTVWVKGKILGVASSGTKYTGALTENMTNVALGDEGNTWIPVGLGSSTTERLYFKTYYEELLNKEVMFYATIGTYFSTTGIPSKSSVKAFTFTEEAPVSKLNVRTEEGYATFVSDFTFEVPEGVKCGIITDAQDGVLNINYNYTSDTEQNVVPAQCPVLVKTDGKNTFNLVFVSTPSNFTGTNLLKAGTGSEIEAEAGHYYYKLAYDDYTTREGLGFYWGADNGGAFTVPEGTAYLDVPSTSTTAIKSFRFEDATTGIAAPTLNEKAEKVAYTIDGRRVDAAHLTKGLYIVNGKKVIVK